MEIIDHCLHPHPLKFYKGLPIDYHCIRCKGCKKWINEYNLCYGCVYCAFYLHISCGEVKLPREIQNFFHPCPLLLNIVESYTCNACFKKGFGFTYRCKGCDFHMQVECAQRPTIKSDSEDFIQHFTHWHPLKHVDTNKHLDVGCAICGKLCSASDSAAYGCEECNFFVHNSCMISIPRQINHSFHPSCPLVLLPWIFYQCKGCDEVGPGLFFRCGKCEFQMDIKCALFPTIESKDADKILHSAHKHPLVLCKSNELDGEVRCRACRESCLLDTCFGCSRSCNFFLHKKCASLLQQNIHHPFHSIHLLTLLRDLPYYIYKCKACDEDVFGLGYRCEECKFHLDSKCAIFPTIESKDANKILHGAHKHPLALFESMEFDNEVRCRACAKSCLAPCFGCMECNFFLHKTCTVESKEIDILHPFHPLHRLTISSPPLLPHRDTFQCSSCLGSDDWNLLRYCCAKCDFNLHIDCAKPPKLTVAVGHIHGLTYFDRMCAPVQCSICREDAQTSFFRCLACAFNIHIYCIPSTPKTITHNRHSHPLTVTKSPFEFELISCKYGDGSNDELFCDVCEKERFKFESVYYCADCKYIAEVRCVLSELLPSLMISSKDQRTMEGKVLSRDEERSALEANIANVNRKIVKFKQQKRDLKRKVEVQREILKKFEEQLEQNDRKLRKLKTDNFFNKYRLSHEMKEHNNLTQEVVPGPP